MPEKNPEKLFYTPHDIQGLDYHKDLGDPGQFPFTRGIHNDMYTGRLWTMRQFSGFGSAKDTNERYHFLLDRGQTGLSVAFDMPTIMGRDSDDPLAQGEVGRCGVAIDCVPDMEQLFDSIPLDKISTSMTINGPAAVLLAFYLVAAERQGVNWRSLRGTIQNDILKEYIAQKSWLFPPKPSLRIIADILAFCTEHVPQWNTISISGYHIREAGSTAVQELAFTLADGFTYVEVGIATGLDVDAFAPRLSFFFNAHNNLFEEVAKYRAARRIWSRRMKDQYGARDPRSLTMRFHTQTAGCSLTAQQPEVNIVRTAYQALAAALGGTQSLHTNSMDETHALPTEKACQIALRTQQVLACETGVPDVVDPLAGSYYIESLTNKMEEEAERYFTKIEGIGGVIAGIEAGFFQKEIAHAAYEHQKGVEEGRNVVVGVNRFVDPDEKLDIPILRIDPRVEHDQIARLAELKRTRNADAVRNSLSELTKSARDGSNVMPPIVDCARVGCTLGEIVGALRDVFGTWYEPQVF